MDPEQYTLALIEDYDRQKALLDAKMSEWAEATEKLESYGIQQG